MRGKRSRPPYLGTLAGREERVVQPTNLRSVFLLTMKLLTRLLAILLLVLGSVLNVQAAPLSGQPRENKELRTADPTAFIQDHIIVKFKPDVSRSAQESIHRRLGSRLLKTS